MEEGIIALVLELDDKNFTKEVKLSEKPIVLVDFYADWEDKCKEHEKILPALSEKYEHVKVCRVNVDKAQKIAARYGILTVPTILVFRQGQIINMQIGVQSEENLANMIM